MDEASNTAASNSGEKQKFFAGSVTFCGQRYTCQCRGSSSKSASAVGVDAGHSRSRRRSVTDVGLPLAGTHRPGSLHRFSENLRRIRGCPRGRQSRRPLHDSGKFVLPRKFRMQGGKDGAAGGASETASTERAPALCAKSLILCVRFLLSKPQTLCWFAA